MQYDLDHTLNCTMQTGRQHCFPAEIWFCLCCSRFFQQMLTTVQRTWNYREWFEELNMVEAFQGGMEGPSNPPVWDSSEQVRNVFSPLVAKQPVFDSCKHPLGMGVSQGGVQQQQWHKSELPEFVVLKYVTFSPWARLKRTSFRALYLTLKGLLVCTNCVPWILIW